MLFRSSAVKRREITTEPRRSDKVFRSIVSVVALSAFAILAMIGTFLALRGFQTFHSQGWHFLTGYEWEVVTDDAGKTTAKFGIGAMLVGTVLISIVALMVGVPLSILTALFLTFYAPERFKKFLVAVVDLMAAFPSILYGLWGYFVLMPMAIYWAKLLHKYLGWIPVFNVKEPFFERSPFVAGLVLAIMIIPIVTSVAREIFSQTPLDRVQAAYALGATRWSMIRNVAIPYARSGIVGSAMLGLGRAMGETVAVFTVLNIVYQINWHILLSAGGNVASLIILKFGEASPQEVKALMEIGRAHV